MLHFQPQELIHEVDEIDLKDIEKFQLNKK